MAIEFGKGIALAGNFDLGAKSPLDSRLVVATIEDRDAHVTGNRAYEGMLVYVEADKITYQYVADEEGNLSWKEFGFSEADFLGYVVNDLETDNSEKVLSAAQGVILKGLIDAEAERAAGVEEGLQSDLDELTDLVGALPEGTSATSVVDYVNIKTAGIATDAALEELNNQVSGLQTAVQAIQDDYLVEEDKTELQNNINAVSEKADKNATAITEAVETLEAADEAQVNRIAALEGQITGLSGAMHFKGVVETNPTTITEGYDNGDTVIYGNKEYVWNNGAFVEFGDASANAEAITNLTGRMDTAEGEIDALQAADVTINEALAKKVEQSVYDAKVAELADADESLGERIAVIEGKFGDGDDSVAEQIATAVAAEKAEREAADALKANKTTVEGIDGRVGTLETDVEQANKDIDAVEAAVATKAEQAGLEAEVSAREALDARVVVVEGKAHVHENADELAKIADGDVAKWNAIEENAAKYTDDEINKVEAIIGDIDADKTVVQLIADLRTECEANETQAVADANAYTDQKIDAVNATIGTVDADKTVVQLIAEAREAAIASAEEKDAVVLQTANAYTDEKVAAIDLSGITTNANAITELQADVAELQAVEHVEISQEEINNLFPTA